MKTFTKISSAVTLSLVASTMLHATNGDTLIAVGAKARGMGGVGIGLSHGAESTLTNPSLITTVENSEISFGGTLFMPDVKTGFGNTTLNQQANPVSSDADMNMIPEVSLAHKLNDNWYIGVGMWGTAGMGVDYRNAGVQNGANVNMHMVTNLQLMQFAVPIAYKTGGLSVAIAPILQYGNLDINYNGALLGGVNAPTPPAPANFINVSAGAGLAQDFGFGWSVGANYDFNNGLIVGAVYKSAIEMNYDGQLSSATQPFVALGIFPAAMADTLEQPAEYGLGFSYNYGAHTIGLDWKRIKWSGAKGYKDFGWDDQDVIAVGYQYDAGQYAVRLGYSRASETVKELNGNTPAGAALNMFNLLGFPATVQNHLTLGGTYRFTKTFSFDLAYVHAFEETTTFSTQAFQGYSNYNPNEIVTIHSQNSLSFQLTYDF